MWGGNHLLFFQVIWKYVYLKFDFIDFLFPYHILASFKLNVITSKFYLDCNIYLPIGYLPKRVMHLKIT